MGPVMIDVYQCLNSPASVIYLLAGRQSIQFPLPLSVDLSWQDFEIILEPLLREYQYGMRCRIIYK